MAIAVGGQTFPYSAPCMAPAERPGGNDNAQKNANNNKRSSELGATHSSTTPAKTSTPTDGVKPTIERSPLMTPVLSGAKAALARVGILLRSPGMAKHLILPVAAFTSAGIPLAAYETAMFGFEWMLVARGMGIGVLLFGASRAISRGREYYYTLTGLEKTLRNDVPYSLASYATVAACIYSTMKLGHHAMIELGLTGSEKVITWSEVAAGTGIAAAIGAAAIPFTMKMYDYLCHCLGVEKSGRFPEVPFGGPEGREAATRAVALRSALHVGVVVATEWLL